MGSTMVTKTPDDIEKIVLKNYPNAYEIVITQGQDGNNIYYIADFLTDKFDGELKLDPVTGAICERELNISKRKKGVHQLMYSFLFFRKVLKYHCC